MIRIHFVLAAALFCYSPLFSQVKSGTPNTQDTIRRKYAEGTTVTVHENGAKTIVGASGSDSDLVFTIVENIPEFKGGGSEMDKFISKNLKYPKIAEEARITGTVYISFVVDENGSLSDVKAIRGLGGGLTEEAIRVIKLMPAWTPGKQNGRAVRVQFTLPVRFVL